MLWIRGYMKSKKVIEIKTAVFELKIFWNGTLVASQGTILLGILLLRIFTQAEAMKALTILLLLLDLFAVLFIAFAHSTIEVKDNVDKSNKQSKSSNNTKTVKPKEPPKPTAKDRLANAKPAQKQNTESKMDSNTESKIENKPAGSVTLLDELSDEDWDALFNFDSEE